MLGLVGATSIDTRVADVTVRAVLPETLPMAAVMVLEPATKDVARPTDPAALLTDATAVSDELQAASEVRSFVVLSV